MKVFFMVAILIIFPSLVLAGSAYEDTVKGKKCKESDSQQLDCDYKIGKDLEFSIGGIGMPDTGITFMHSNIDGDYYATYGSMHSCIIIKHGNKSDPSIRFSDYAFVSPQNGKVYKTWKDCKEGY